MEREYKTPREFIERVFYNGEEASMVFLGTPFEIELYDRTKNDDDFAVLWDSEWQDFFSLDERIAVGVTLDIEYFNNSVAARIYSVVGDTEGEATPIEAYNMLKKVSENIDFPWGDVIEKLRKGLKDNLGGA